MPFRREKKQPNGIPPYSTGSKFYSKSLTLMASILEMIKEGLIAVDIARNLNLKKSHVSYYVSKGKKNGLIKEAVKDAVTVLELTQAGKNFLDQYDKNNPLIPVCRLENLWLKAPITHMPTIPVDWKKIEAHNWTQYTSQIDTVKVRLNMGKIPTLELFPSAVDGENIYDLIIVVLYECINATLELYDKIGLRIGKLQACSKPEWAVYDPIARELCKHNGQVTYDGLGKVNASKPRKIGELEFYDPRALLDYMLMPHRLKDIETMVKKILEQINKKTDA
jgi:predicted transcriptional regulator